MGFRIIFLLFLCSCISLTSNAQEPDSIQVENKKKIKNDTITEKTHSVKTATILSAVLPGAGQIYNHIAMPKGKKKAFWKVPLIYAGLGVTTYFLISNQRNMMIYRNEYMDREELGYLTTGGYVNPATAGYDPQALLTLHENYQTNRDLMILATAGVYLLNVLDAAVEAHFVSFDISEDLTMSFRPKVMMGFSPGLSVSFNFR